MTTNPASGSILLVALLLAGAVSSEALGAPDLSDRVVLANLDRYEAYLRFGEVLREIKPKKASALSPKQYPVMIEYWSGDVSTGWKKQTIREAGVYGFEFAQGRWSLTKLVKGTSWRAVVSSPKIDSKPAKPRPSPVVLRDRSPAERAAYAAAQTYQFAQDEQDRERLRRLLTRARQNEDFDRVERWLLASAVPEDYRKELREAYEDLARLRSVDRISADEEDWIRQLADLGDLVSDDEWDSLGGVDFDLSEFALVEDDPYESSLELSDVLDLVEDVDLDEIGIDTHQYDLDDVDF